MKKRILLVTAVILMLPTMAFGWVHDITINDNMNPSATWGTDVRGVAEDSESEFHTTANQSWDLEAVLLQSIEQDIDHDGELEITGYNMMLVGGWDFLGTMETWKSGDIFFAFRQPYEVEPFFGNGINGSVQDGNPIISNSVLGYDYVLDMDRSPQTADWSAAGGYNVIDLNSPDSALLKTAYYDQNEGANPYAYYQGGNVTGITGVATISAYANNGVGGLPVFEGDTHYLAFFDITDIVELALADTDTDCLQMWVHFSQECGNDSLMGSELFQKTSHAPEPSSILLLLLGLGGALARKLRA